MTTHASFRAKWLSAAALGFSALLTIPFAGCNGNAQSAPIVDASGNGDPAAANLAPVGNGQPTQVMGTSASYAPQQSSQSYPQQPPAPIEQNYNQNDDQQSSNGDYDEGYQDGQAAVYANQAPPPLPEYDQPPAPDENDLWTPGYWDYENGYGYYWVPGAWVAAPYYGALWTPGYWDYYGGRYRFHRGYWGRHVGYYGGINYGFGYIGIGYEGGYWQGNSFFYNRNVNRIDNSRIHTVYSRPISNNGGNRGRVSFNGPGGVQARPQPAELAARREQHTAPMQTQVNLRNEAQKNRSQSFNANHGRPAQTAAPRPIAATPGITPPTQRDNGNGPMLPDRIHRGPDGQPLSHTNGNVQPGQPGMPNQGVRDQNPGRDQRPGQPQTQPGQPQPGQVAQPNQGRDQNFGRGQRQGQPNNTHPGATPQQPAVQNQQQLQNQQRIQQDQQRALQQQQQQTQQRTQQEQQRTQQRQQQQVQQQQQQVQQQNQQRQQQMQQQNRDRSQEMQQRQQGLQQRAPQAQQPAPAPRVETPRPAPAAPAPRAEAPRPAPAAPRAEPPRAAPAAAAAPAPHAEAPHPNHPEGGHEDRH